MFKIQRQNLLHNIKNIPGWRTNRKILIIECDDWGGIRMPSQRTYKYLLNKGLSVDVGWFNRLDTLENSKDLEQLFDVLSCVKDKNGNHPIITAITIVANPDFDKIRSSGFNEYHYESFMTTLKRYYPNNDVFKLWHEGIASGIFVPELHGRDHITVQLWLEKLREGNGDLLTAFDNGFTSLDVPGIPFPAGQFRAEFYFTADDQKPFLINSVKDSIQLFYQIFGFTPRIFVPPNGIFHPDFEMAAASNGIKYLYVNLPASYPVARGKMRYRFLITGQEGFGGIRYYTRNCSFEPSDERYRGIDLTLKQISAAFRWGKPAIISTHRVNFIGGIEPSNREKGLSEFKKLLCSVVRLWPEVEFMNSGDALDHLININ